MGFFARPRLSNEQFVQHTDDVLTLSGVTQIATTSGLTLIGTTGGTPQYIPIQATGGSNNFVLTYDDTGASPVIKLKLSSVSGGTSNYPYAESATTTVGGLPAGQNLYDAEIVNILHDILVPTVESITSDIVSSLSLAPLTTLYEVGAQPTIYATSNFDRGCVFEPRYCGTNEKISGFPIEHEFCAFWAVPATTAVTTSLSVTCNFVPIIGLGDNPIYSRVSYSSGATPIYNSAGGEVCPTAPAAIIPSIPSSSTCKNLCGIHPWYWGVISSSGASSGGNRPSSGCVKDVITGCTEGVDYNKEVSISTGTLDVVFGSTDDDYLWFATPSGSTSKQCWFVCSLNHGCIDGVATPGAGYLFPDPELVSDVCSCAGCWDSQGYKIYISNYQTAASVNMEIRNS